MILEQFYLGCLSHASYILGDEKTKTAVIVDPQRDVDLYLEAAAEKGLKIKHVFLTHFHADFLAGHLELREKTGAVIHLGASAEAEFAFVPAKDGEVYDWGDLRVKIMETPGHTPEGISLLVYDLAQSADKPKAVLTGDTLFVGDVGRPDLLASIGYTSEQLGDMLYDSIHSKLLKLEDDVIVYPAHGKGSMCGKNLGDDPFSTIGKERIENYALADMSKEQFLDIVTEDQPEAPHYFVHDAILNRKEHELLGPILARALKPLSLEDVCKLRGEGKQILDAREPADYAREHLKGSINVGLEGPYASQCGSVLDLKIPIVVIADPDEEEEAVVRLGRIGLANTIVGFLEGGADAWEGKNSEIASIPIVKSEGLKEMLDGDSPPVILDVRVPMERNRGAIANTVWIPLIELPARMGELDKTKHMVVSCETGFRSATALGILENAGFDKLTYHLDGYFGWSTRIEGAD